MKQLTAYFLLMRFHKPIGILLLLWPTLWGLWLAAQGVPDYVLLLIFLAGVVVMRAAGCVINDMADRQFDKYVERTRLRPLAAGTLSMRAAFVLLVVLLSMALWLLLQLNQLTVAFGFVGAGLAVIYPFLKRLTHLPQGGLGLAFSWGVPMAFAAVQHTVPRAAWLLFATAVLWPIIYDTFYAMVDQADDIKIGVKSTAILFGRQAAKILVLLQILFVGGLLGVGYCFHLSFIYVGSVGLAALLCFYQQRLLTQGKPFQAFLNNNWLGMIIFIGIAWSEWR